VEVRRRAAREPRLEADEGEDERVHDGARERRAPRGAGEPDEQRDERDPADPSERARRKRDDGQHAGDRGGDDARHADGTAMSRRAWWVAVALAPVLVLFIVCALNALAWLGRPFPGLLVLENGIVVSIGRTEWANVRYRNLPF